MNKEEYLRALVTVIDTINKLDVDSLGTVTVLRQIAAACERAEERYIDGHVRPKLAPQAFATMWADRVSGKTWETHKAYVEELEAFDAKVRFKSVRGKAMIVFSDGSMYTMPKQA